MGQHEVEADKRAMVLHEQVYMLFNAIPSSVLASVFGSMVALFIYRGAVSTTRLYLWVSMLLIITLIRSLQYRSFVKARPGPDQIDRWYTRFRIGSILWAAVVGSAGFLLFNYETETFQLILALMMVCIAAFAISTLSPRPELVSMFLILILTPLIGTLYLTHTGAGSYIFWMMLMLLCMLLLSALRLSRTIARSIELTIEAGFRERDLHNFQQRLALYVKETPLAVIEWDGAFAIKAWNPAATTIFGYSAEEARSSSLPALVFNPASSSQLPAIWQGLMADSADSHQLVLENRNRAGKPLQCEWFNTLLSDDSGQTSGILSLVQDVTQRMETERLKQEFVSIVSHELRTPVTSIKGSLSLLASGILSDDPKQGQEMLEIALTNTNRLQLLINDILDVDKLESGKIDYRFRDCDLVALLNDSMTANQSYATQFNVTLASTGFPVTCRVSIDPDRIFQVLNNVLSNAIKFSTSGGTVTLSLQVKGKQVRVAVNNRGEVIPSSDREKMFGKFFQRDSSTTRSRQGSGLGLYICQKILQEHASALDFSSSTVDGTTFFFSLALPQS
jgi:PAS domain S-box-containing protein